MMDLKVAAKAAQNFIEELRGADFIPEEHEEWADRVLGQLKQAIGEN